jgi:type I restriction enzyme M protein
MTPDVSRRDTENIPLTEKIDDYIAREVLPYQPEAWIDQSKTKVGYEIPFSQIFHEYRELESSTRIAARITAREQQLSTQLRQLFAVEGRHDL